ncbi:MAG: nucleotide pyrophosphohydrolase [Tepidisphaerales bacterium]
MATLDELTRLTLAFRAERNWQQFHNPKDLAICLCLEAGEVLELMQWRNGPDLEQHLTARQRDLADELSDVLHAVLLLAHDRGIDLAEAYRDKMRRNAEKYPADKARDRAAKYTEL